MRQVPYDPLTLAVEQVKKSEDEVGQKEVQVRVLNVQRAQAYALMEIAESLREIRDLLETRG
ncbi:MAG TPA: hypothetical protein VF944_11600 [Candidatus Bathyarchaeia archaeon]